ncbi:bifunctional N-glycosylase/AP lyase NTG1 NDAI_0H02450 [Naumovozyma dairenensis CBS 421]|uniref:Endonuclease III homolog n=1 Tax=Naumovozyma dairenensis (strain ATCC 10597 / BCRC 20456 / CBS 421 / NBRC 0211 / NRRL Y-12639) TaxID=1071378 RepID=G0WF58_NAUDC|nr:hypothetical protein NDAI_0H02450 [Naumovozyma dairenensis CBS 421]CCD26419.1 hypothetical protein NDAI_0H02450 [Naumovozyma dairenensis CBS 421]
MVVALRKRTRSATTTTTTIKKVTKKVTKKNNQTKSKTIKVESKYFVKKKPKLEQEEIPSLDDVDTEWVKTLNNKDYFEWLSTKTGNVPNRWSVPLPSDAFINKTGNPIPLNFKPIYSFLRSMRSKVITPVDLVGGSSIPMTIGRKCGIPFNEIEPKNYRYQVLTSVMLSAQTKDEVTAKAMYNIMRYCIDELGIPQGLTLEGILQMDEDVIDELIKSVGFHTRKAHFIKMSAEMIRTNFQSDVPTNIPDLLSLPGVGPKMAYLTLQKAWGKMEGICVDVHVHRLCKLFKWVDPNSKNPEQTRKELQSWLPPILWREINSLLVGYGQIIDRSRGKIPKREEEDADDVKDEETGIVLEKEKKKKTNDYLEITQLEQGFRSHMTNYTSWVKYLTTNANNLSKLEIKIESNHLNVKKEDETMDLFSEEPNIDLKLEHDNLASLTTPKNESSVKLEESDRQLEEISMKTEEI